MLDTTSRAEYFAATRGKFTIVLYIYTLMEDLQFYSMRV